MNSPRRPPPGIPGMPPPGGGPGNVDPIQIVAQYFGLGVPTLRAMGVNAVPCLCGKCQGIGIQFEARMHFPMLGGPEIIRRDAGAAKEPEVRHGEPTTSPARPRSWRQLCDACFSTEYPNGCEELTIGVPMGVICERCSRPIADTVRTPPRNP